MRIIKYDICSIKLAKQGFRGKGQQEVPPPLQTNKVVGPPTMKEKMFRFKLVF